MPKTYMPLNLIKQTQTNSVELMKTYQEPAKCNIILIELLSKLRRK